MFDACYSRSFAHKSLYIHAVEVGDGKGAGGGSYFVARQTKRICCWSPEDLLKTDTTHNIQVEIS